MGDASHHTDLPFTQEDIANGDRLADVLGDLFADVGAEVGPDDKAKLKEVYFDFFYRSLTSAQQWQRVARALRSGGYHIYGGSVDKAEWLDDEPDGMQDVFHVYRQASGDHKMNFVPWDWHPERISEFAKWLRMLADRADLAICGPVDEGKPCIFCGKPTGILTISLFCFVAHEKCRQLAGGVAYVD